MKNQNTPIATEGIPFIAGFSGLTVILVYLASIFCSVALSGLSALFALLTLFSIYFFRNPERTTPTDPSAVIAPADGTVVVSEVVDQSPLGGRALKISIFMSVFNVHINRVPFSGKIVELKYVRGKFLDVRDERSSSENERSTILLETATGSRIAFVQIAGLIARRIVCYPVLGDMLERGRRYGLIRFGSRLDVFLPADVAAMVKVGDKTISGETILGRLV